MMCFVSSCRRAVSGVMHISAHTSFIPNNLGGLVLVTISEFSRAEEAMIVFALSFHQRCLALLWNDRNYIGPSHLHCFKIMDLGSLVSITTNRRHSGIGLTIQRQEADDLQWSRMCHRLTVMNLFGLNCFWVKGFRIVSSRVTNGNNARSCLCRFVLTRLSWFSRFCCVLFVK